MPGSCRFALARVHPRIRGEYAEPRFQNAPVMGSPPHTRGIQTQKSGTAGYARFTPAYAGNTFGHCFRERETQVHPRIRGEYCQALPCLHCFLGSPPHTRGILDFFRLNRFNFRFTPAYAGNTEASKAEGDITVVHPRIRGEYRISRGCTETPKGSPPHTRGILPADEPEVVRGGFTPAYAGNTQS